MTVTSETRQGGGERRRGVFSALAVFLTLVACIRPTGAVTLDVVTFNYLDRPVLDVFIGEQAGDSSMPYPETGGSTIMGVRFRPGPQKVTWRLDGPRGTPRNGETVTAKNVPVLGPVLRDAVFLGVHIYPDETVELIPTRHYPRATEKGKAMVAASGAVDHVRVDNARP